MAAIFQLRRGSGSVSLVDGELYLHKSSGSLQVSLGDGNPITLARLDQINSGSLKLSGDVSASNAYFSGDVAISGNLYLGNAPSDNISALGQFTTNLVPNPNNGIDIGTTSAVWANVYANRISGSQITGSLNGNVNGINITTLSTSVDSRLDNIESFTSSVTGSTDKIAYFAEEDRITSFGHSFLNSETFGLGTNATSSTSERLMVDSQTFNIATFQTSQNDSFAEVNIKNFGSGSAASADLVIWNDIATESSSYVDFGINSSNYSAGFIGYQSDGYLYSANNDLYVGSASTGSHGHVHIFGGFLWQSASISVYNDGTIGINTDKLNNSASTIPTAGYAMEISGGVKFDNSIDVIGNISSSTISGIGNVTAYSSSIDNKLHRLFESTQSLNDYSQSLKAAIDVTGGNTRILGNLIVDGNQTSLNTTNVYIEDFKITLASGSTNSSEANGAGFEIAGANVSMSWEHPNARFILNTNLAAIGEISSSTIAGLGNASQFASAIQASTASLNTFSASVLGHISDINTKTGSFENKFTTIQNVTASYNQHTASLNTYTQSVNGHITDLNSWTASQNQKDVIISGITASYDFFTGSATASIVSLFGTASNHEVRIDDLEAKAGTLQTYTASVEGRFTTISNVTSSLNLHTASLNQFTSSTYSTFSTSVDLRLDQLEYTTSILTPEGQAESFAGLNAFTTSANNRLNNLELVSASLLVFSSSTDSRLDNLELHTGSYATTGSNVFVGDQVVSGSMTVTGTINATTINTTFVSSSVQYATGSNKFGTDQSNTHEFTGSVYISGSLYVHSPYVTVAHFEGDQNGYAEFSLRNVNTGISASTDLAIYADNGTAFTNYVDVGINNSGLTASYYYGGAYFGGPNDAYMYSTGNDLRIGNATGGKYLYIFNNATANPIIAITPSQGIEISGSTIFTNGITGSISATNGVVSGSSQVVLSSTNGFTTFSSSLDSRFDGIESYTSSNDTTNALQTTRIDQLAAATASVNNFSASVLGHISDINSYTSSLKTALSVSGADVVVAGNLTVLGDTVTLNVGNLSIEDKTIVIASGSTSSTLSDGAGLYISGADASILWNHLNTRLDINKSIDVAGNITLSGTIDGVDVSGHVSDINTKTGSFETKFGTLQTYTASVNGHISDINAYTASNDTTNSTQNNRLSRLEESTSSLNLFTSSINTTIKERLNVEGIVSGSSQIDLVATTNYASGILTRLNVVGVFSGSSQVDATSTTNWSSGVKTQLNNNTVVSGSSQITLSSTTGGGTSANVQFGSLGIGTAASGISGEIRATGDITAYYSSDERLKENIIPIPNALEKVNQISGNTYDWKEGYEEVHSHKGNDVGVIAQEIEQILPQIVTNRDTGFKAVQYEKIIPLLIEAIKELSAKIDRLENK